MLTKLEKDFITDRKSVGEFKEIAGFYPKPELSAKKAVYGMKMIPKGTHKEFATSALQTINEISRQ